MFRDRFWLTLALSIPTLIWSSELQKWLGYRAPAFPGSVYIPPLFGTAVFLYGGLVFLQGAVHEIRQRRPGMMTLIGLAITVAFLFSLAVTLGYQGMAFWWELSTLVVIMLLGHWIEMHSTAQASGALKELAGLLPNTALRMKGDETEEVPLGELHEGDVVLIRPGDSIPADGIVHSGASEVNEAMITGESMPASKAPGARVVAGTLNGQGSLRVEVTATGDRTFLSGIMRLVEQAQASRSRSQILADRAAVFLTFAAIGSAVITLIVWTFLKAPSAWTVERVVTVLVIACPHALGLAIPLVVAISTTLGARNGLIIRDRRGLEEARNITTVVFDKTGTLTRGEFRVTDVTTVNSIAPEEALRLAAAVERESEHTIARGIVKSAEEKGLVVPPAEGFRAVPGEGATAKVAGRILHAGGPAILKRLNAEPDSILKQAADRAAERGETAVYLLDGRQVLSVLAVADAIRPESREAVRRLHGAGIKVAMLTGDSRAVAASVAAETGIDQVFAEVLPREKASIIEDLKRQGLRVAMVGDGVNDAPALLTSHVGVAIGAGTAVAVEAGDVVLVRNDPRDVPRIIELSKAGYRKMVQNLWWAAGYNIIAIPLAAGILAGQGIVLHPAVGAVLMSASTVIVAVNAQLLRRASI